MTDYKSLYYDLFNKVSDVINLLQEAQRDTEKDYVSYGSRSMRILRGDDDENEQYNNGKP